MKNDNGQDWISFLFCKHCLIHNQKDNGTFGITISEDNHRDELVKIAGVILVHQNRMKVLSFSSRQSFSAGFYLVSTYLKQMKRLIKNYQICKLFSILCLIFH